ncbi:ALK tyrosine kinase receptor-like [Stylophora pistillata]|uniref:ALK tyrosine kinase receptor-like n=1 Tax=Stylophora pistillata TaxID=50429 RepID=UPI000C03E3BE|nr:ALK tyrosine kinase receptor-like [Stylophora pistillata]
MRFLSKFLALMFIFLQSGRSEIIKRSVFFNTNENVRLDSSEIISRQTSRGALSCSQKCLSEPLCSVFNYGSTSASQGICELYKTSSDGMKLIHESGWLCGHLHGPRKMFKAPTECKTWRTKDGGCCVFPFLYHGKNRDSCVIDKRFGLWCSTTSNYDVDKRRSVCEDFKFTFTTLGAVGRTGPTDSSGYKGKTLQGQVKIENGIQLWTVPLSGSYFIEAWGASGADGRESADVSAATRAGGKGAYVKGTFNLTLGKELKILVGQTGSRGKFGRPLPGGGGGGTFITSSADAPLIIAGGGGGGVAQPGNFHKGDPGQTSQNGSRAGGSNGSGGNLYEQGSPSASFECGAGGHGGFGGGGAAFLYPGAGGGYSGGGVVKNKEETNAGGGGSFNSGAKSEKEEGLVEGDGKVIITLLEADKEFV